MGMNGDSGDDSDNSDKSGQVKEAENLVHVTDKDVTFSVEKDTSLLSSHKNIQLQEEASDEDKLKALWFNMMEGPPSPEDLKSTVKDLGKRDMHRKSMYQHLLAQLSYPFEFTCPLEPCGLTQNLPLI